MKIVTIIGASSVLGKALIRKLAKQRYRIYAITNDASNMLDLTLLGVPGQIEVLPLPNDNSYLTTIVERSYVVMNLTLVNNNRHKGLGKKTDCLALAYELDELCQAKKVHYIQMMPYVTSHVATQPLELLASDLKGQIVYTSLVYAKEDDWFVNVLTSLKYLPVYPVYAAKAEIQPIYAGDVASALMTLIAQPLDTTIYYLAGPETYRYEAMLQLLAQKMNKHRLWINLPNGLVRLKARFLGLVFKGLNLEVYNLLSSTALLPKNDLKTLGVYNPTQLPMVIDEYIWIFYKQGQFETHQYQKTE